MRLSPFTSPTDDDTAHARPRAKAHPTLQYLHNRVLTAHALRAYGSYIASDRRHHGSTGMAEYKVGDRVRVVDPTLVVAFKVAPNLWTGGVYVVKSAGTWGDADAALRGIVHIGPTDGRRVTFAIGSDNLVPAHCWHDGIVECD